MKPRNALVSKVAAAALAFGLAQSGNALAQDNTESVSQQSATTQQADSKSDFANSWSISTDPLIPIGLIAGLALLYGAASLMAARKSVKGAWLRATAGGVLAVALINPEIMTEDRETQPTEVIVVVDKSTSQTLDGRDQTTQAAYDDVLRQLSRIPGANVRTVEVDGLKDGVADDGTRLFKAVDEATADIPRDHLGAVIMLTDGVVHDAEGRAQAVEGGAPLHVLVSGREGEIDRRIILETIPHFGKVNEEQEISFRVVDDGVPVEADSKLRVTITVGGKEVASRQVTPDKVTSVRVNIPQVGNNVIELRAENLDGELTAVNNRAAVNVTGVQESMNVLLVSGMPDANMRMWRDLIKADPDANLINIAILRPAEKQDNTPLKELSMISLPAGELFAEKLKDFDLVIFDRYAYDGLVAAPYLDNVAKYVRDGGAMLVVAGPEYARVGSLSQTPLAAVLPAQPTGQIIDKVYSPVASALGERHPVGRTVIPAPGTQWGPWLRTINVSAPKGSVVMNGADGKPLLILNRQDEGRVALLLSDNAWLWQRGYQGGGPSEDLLKGIMGWLVKNPAYAEESLNITKQGSQIVIDQQTMANSSTPVTLHTPSGKTVRLVPDSKAPGLWRAAQPANEIGLYRVEQGGAHPASAVVDVGPDHAREYDNTISTTTILQAVAQADGGSIQRMEGVDRKLSLPRVEARTAENLQQGLSGEGWIGVRMNEKTTLKGMNGQPLLPPWAAMLLIIAALAEAFAREGDRSLLKKETWARRPKDNDGPVI